MNKKLPAWKDKSTLEKIMYMAELALTCAIVFVAVLSVPLKYDPNACLTLMLAAVFLLIGIQFWNYKRNVAIVEIAIAIAVVIYFFL